MKKNIVIPVFLDVQMYAELEEAKKEKKIIAKTDSELIRKMLYDYLRTNTRVVLELDKMRDRIGVETKNNAKLQETVSLLHSTINELRSDNDRLKNNIRIQKKKAKK